MTDKDNNEFEDIEIVDNSEENANEQNDSSQTDFNKDEDEAIAMVCLLRLPDQKVGCVFLDMAKTWKLWRRSLRKSRIMIINCILLNTQIKKRLNRFF